MEIRAKNGKYKSLDVLTEDAVEQLVDVINDLSEDEQFELSNLYRDNNGYDLLYRNDEEGINGALSDMAPYDVLQIDYECYAEYFTYDGYDGVEFTNDLWANIDVEDIARAVLDDELRYGDLPLSVQEVFDEFTDACEELENVSAERKKVIAVISDYVNCKADVTDLLQTLERIARNDELWEG